jgi:hypothetical protein
MMLMSALSCKANMVTKGGQGAVFPCVDQGGGGGE